ncbi:MAG TPA: right-handed parallel beta-helix repeat-containing protein, partial [bacterium]|nr:right-handed parallel beta-helix repeat-containing protein [bacterium]
MKKIIYGFIIVLFLCTGLLTFAEITPEDVEARVEGILKSAYGYMEKGNHENARREFAKLKDVSGLDGAREMSLFNIAESYRQEKDYAGAHRIYGDIMKLDKLADYYRIYGLFQQADIYIEQKDYKTARRLYEEIAKSGGASGHHVFTAQLKTADTYRAERRYSLAADMCKRLLIEQENSAYPHEGYRLDLRDMLEAMEGLADGAVEKSRQEKLAEWVKSPKHAIYVSLRGKDNNSGTKEQPFATIERAREEVRKLNEKGMPPCGVAVYLRGGKYFLDESIILEGKKDSGTEAGPVVYRNYPGEEVRLIGGVQIEGFKPLADPEVLRRLPEESRRKVMVADLKESEITDYGILLSRGYAKAAPPEITNVSAMELIYNGGIMQLSRWPNEGWARVAGLVNPRGDYLFRNTPYQKGKFIYSGDRPGRWKEEKEIWLKGYMGPKVPYFIKHLKVTSIDSDKKIIYVADDPRWAHLNDPASVGNRISANTPYFAYNLLSEIDMPGEWYIDRETGRLYFYPPGDIEGSEVIATMLEAPLVQFKGVSNIVFYGLTVEGGRSHAFEIKGGRNNVIAGCVIRNTGQWAVKIEKGWEHKVAGCDIHDTGEGGVSLDGGGDRAKLIPARHLVENNHICRFNRFCGGYRQGVSIQGVGQRVSHNVIHDSPHQGIYLDSNDHVVEFNEFHDAPHEAKENGFIYIYGIDKRWLSRGSLIRNNFFHHITDRSSPNLSHALVAIHVDGRNGGMVIEKNIFYRFPYGISSSHPDMRHENNLFIDGEGACMAIADRGRDFFVTPEGKLKTDSIESSLARNLRGFRYKQPPWSYRYPQLVNSLIVEGYPMRTENTVVERNVNTGGAFLAMGRNVAKYNMI